MGDARLVTATADDYVWFTERCDIALAYTLTLVHGLTPQDVVGRIEGLAPDDVIRRIGGADLVPVTGLRRLTEAAAAVTHRPDAGEDGAFHADRLTGLVLLALAQVDGWTLVVEPAGALCLDEDVAGPLSAGTTLVTHSYSEHSDPVFRWMRDGDTLVRCDPSAAGWREGSDPDRLLGVMERLGFDLGTEELDPADPRWTYDPLSRERAFALAEEVTGVRLTQESLAATTFLCAAVPDPSTTRWLTGDPARTGPFSLAGLATLARHELADVAATPEPEDDGGAGDVDWWAGISGPDEDVRATGWSGVQLAGHDWDLLGALTQAGDDVRRAVARWAREWACTTADLTGQPWFIPVVEAVRRGDPLSWTLESDLRPHLEPLPVAPIHGPDGSLDRGSRQHLAVEGLLNPTDPDPLTAACDAIASAAAVDAGRYTRLLADLRRAFPQLAT
jgi:hypothetical protein